MMLPGKHLCFCFPSTALAGTSINIQHRRKLACRKTKRGILLNVGILEYPEDKFASKYIVTILGLSLSFTNSSIMLCSMSLYRRGALSPLKYKGNSSLPVRSTRTIDLRTDMRQNTQFASPSTAEPTFMG